MPRAEWLVATSVVCTVWLALLAYLLDWLCGRVGGETDWHIRLAKACAAGVFNLDEQLLGETVVAAATSAPNVMAAWLQSCWMLI